ncbi:hypothetical protein L0F63_004545 [Massospora cicadina]|nr:hypothetical protein L0F63_004545 [Massospora cicadina]
MQLLTRPVGWVVSSLSRAMPVQTDFLKPMQGSWYISPAQHGFEMLLLTAFFYLVFIFSIKYVCRPGNDLISLLQPCHVNLVVLIFILNFPKKYTLPHFVFNIFVHGIWGTLLALSAPDLRGYDMLLEVENFWFEHYLLLFAPFLLMFTGRYVLWPPSFAVGILAFSFNALYNVPFLSTLALLTGLNVNYMLSPPPGILEVFGPYYRVAFMLLLCAISLLLRFTLTELGRALVARSKSYYYSGFASSFKGSRAKQR